MSARQATARVARRFVGPLLFVMSVVAVGALAVVPTKTFINQKKATAESEARLSSLQESTSRMQRELDALNRDDELERVARQQYGFVKPGEEVYRIIEPPRPPVTVPGVWPFDDLRKRLKASDVPPPAEPPAAAPAAPAPADPAAPSTTTTTTTTITTVPNGR